MRLALASMPGGPEVSTSTKIAKMIASMFVSE